MQIHRDCVPKKSTKATPTMGVASVCFEWRIKRKQNLCAEFTVLQNGTENVTFLSLNKKVTKEVSIGEALSAGSSRTRAALPYVPHPARTWRVRSTLTN